MDLILGVEAVEPGEDLCGIGKRLAGHVVEGGEYIVVVYRVDGQATRLETVIPVGWGQ